MSVLVVSMGVLVGCQTKEKETTTSSETEVTVAPEVTEEPEQTVEPTEKPEPTVEVTEEPTEEPEPTIKVTEEPKTTEKPTEEQVKEAKSKVDEDLVYKYYKELMDSPENPENSIEDESVNYEFLSPQWEEARDRYVELCNDYYHGVLKKVGKKFGISEEEVTDIYLYKETGIR